MSDADLIAAACAARARAYAPYSQFAVGAAVRGDDGAIYTGANVENASYPEGWCAETSALAGLIAGGGRRISAACIVADSPAPLSPCGGCRQRLAEFADADARVVSVDPSGAVRAQWRLGDLLPAAFALEERP